MATATATTTKAPSIKQLRLRLTQAEQKHKGAMERLEKAHKEVQETHAALLSAREALAAIPGNGASGATSGPTGSKKENEEDQ